MDPLTAIGLASNILSFIDFGFEVVSIAKDIHGSPTASSEDARNIEAIVKQMRTFSARLQPPDETQLIGEEKALCALAAECSSVSEEILRLIEKIRPRDPKSKGSSLAAAFKTKWYESDLRKLQERLDHSRAQLALQLDHLTSSETKSRLDALVAIAQDDSSRLGELYHQVNVLRQGVRVSSLSPTAQAQLRSLLDVSDHVGDFIVRNRIINSLAFGGMYGRYEAVNDAHYKTLEWIFGSKSSDSESGNISERDSNTSSGPEAGPLLAPRPSNRADRRIDAGDSDSDSAESSDDPQDIEDAPVFVPRPPPKPEGPERIAARRRLLEWLSMGSGIFHISGKLGSGKSTLMKFLCEHESTRNRLEQWAGDRSLVFANFFFWKPGSDLQKSLTGLFRSLLHDILEACPDLIPLVLPDHWRSLKSTPWQAMRDIHIPDRNIRDAFALAVTNTSLYRNHCFCFFIDGLDEYEGTHQDDARSLVDILLSWTTTAPDSIKLCVSSREHNVFMNAFSSVRRIRLHELTRADMTHYVSDKLGHMEETEKRKLVDQVVNNSGGIFLWVVLVVKKLREHIENGSTFKELEREINNLPREMDGLFDFLVDSIAESDLKRAYCTFSILLSLTGQHAIWTLSPGLYQYSFLDDYIQDFSFAARLDIRKDRLESDEIARRTAVARKRVVGSCKGLVDFDSKETLEFTHRSVPEFLETRIRLEKAQNLLEGFQSAEALCQITLAAISTNPELIKSVNTGSWVRWRFRSRLDHPPYLFLESFSAVLSQAKELVGGGQTGMDEEEILIPGSIVGSALQKEHIARAKADAPIDPIYPAALFGNYDYVRWKSVQQDHASWPFSREVLLICLIRSSMHTRRRSREEMLQTVEVLMSGRWTAESLTDISYYPMYEFTGDAKVVENKDLRKSILLSVWHHLLFDLYIFGCYIESSIAEQDDRRQLESIGCVLQKFLENGADPRHFRLSAQRLDRDKPGDEIRSPGEEDWRFKLVLGKEERVVSFKLQRQDFQMRPMEVGSLAELIGHFDLESKDRLLQLVDMRCKDLDSAETILQSVGGDGLSTTDASKEIALPLDHFDAGEVGLASRKPADQERPSSARVSAAQGNGEVFPPSSALGTRMSILAFLAVVLIAVILRRFLT